MSHERAPLRERLRTVARLRGYPDDDATLDRLLDYLAAVLWWRGKVNLTAAQDLSDAVEILAVSALAVVETWAEGEPPARVVDFGTGNGLPGVAAALAWPSAAVLLVERRAKKAEAVADCVTRAGLQNTEVLALDARELVGLRPDVRGEIDLVTARAVGSLDGVNRIAASWLAPGGRLAHWKGARLAPEEVSTADLRLAGLGLRLLRMLEFQDEGGPAHLVLYERPRSVQ